MNKAVFRYAIPAIVGLMLTASLYAGGGCEVGTGDFVPQPVLRTPATDTVALKEGEGLTFSWDPYQGDRFRRRYYDFRLYRGYTMLADTLMLKKRLAPDVYSLTLEADLFKNGEVYTWSLRQVYNGIQKSWRSTTSFKVTRE